MWSHADYGGVDYNMTTIWLQCFDHTNINNVIDMKFFTK